MLYPTANQPIIIILVVLTGLVSGLFFDISKALCFLSGNDKVSKEIFNFFAVILSSTTLYFVNLKFNYGQFRFYVVMVFFASLSFERFLSKVLWTKVFAKCYNSIRKKWKKKKKTN